MKKLFITLTISALLAISSGQANAAILWDWQFTDSNRTVGSTDTIAQHARLYNNSTSSETIGIYSLSPTAYLYMAYADVPGEYGYSWGSGGTLKDEFPALIPAGGTVDFTFMTYTPIGTVPYGTYTTPNQWLSLTLKSDYSDLGTISRSYTWYVENGPIVDPVPEPATMILFGLGGIATAFTRRRRKA